MPEGDVVRRTARALDAALAGSDLTVFDLRVPAYATVDLAGHRVEGVVSVGKHLLTRVTPDLTVHSHLRMDGSWHLFRTGQRWTGGPGHTVRAVLGNESWQAVGYRVHDLAVVARGDEHTLVGHLGPDLLADDWDVAEAMRRLVADPDRPIGEALLDQRVVAGHRQPVQVRDALPVRCRPVDRRRAGPGPGRAARAGATADDREPRPGRADDDRGHQAW